MIDFGNDDQNLTANERLAKLKKKEEVRKMLSKQRFALKRNIPIKIRFLYFFLSFSMQELNEHDYHDGDGHSPYNQRRIEKVCESLIIDCLN